MVFSTDAVSCESLFAFARALEDVDAELAAKYATEARQYREDIRRSVERSIALTPVRRLRSGVYRSFSPGTCYARGPFVTFQGGSGYGIEDWLEQGKQIAVKNAPTYFGPAAYEIVSDVDNGRINARVEIPSRNPPKEVVLRLRHPRAAPIKGVTVNGKPWAGFDKDKETISLEGLTGTVNVMAEYR